MMAGPTGIAEPDFERLREEVAIGTFPDGGLLVELRSGNVFQLDATATAVWTAIVHSRHAEEAIAAIGAAHGTTPAQARALFEEALEQSRSNHERSPATPYRIDELDGRMTLCHAERPLLEFDLARATLSLRHRSDPDQPRPEDDTAVLLRMFIPNVLATWFPLALHASAVELSERIVLFAGPSGAGKTTTAHALVDTAGASLVSEDLVVFAEVTGEQALLAGAEPIVRGWMKDAVAAFTASPHAPVDLRGLVRSLHDQRRRTALGKIVFIDAGRRQGETWSLRPLDRPEALTSLFVNSFLSSVASNALRRHLEACRSVAASSSAWAALAVPDGLANLRAASRAQSAMIAS